MATFGWDIKRGQASVAFKKLLIHVMGYFEFRAK